MMAMIWQKLKNLYREGKKKVSLYYCKNKHENANHVTAQRMKKVVRQGTRVVRLSVNVRVEGSASVYYFKNKTKIIVNKKRK